MVLQSDDQEIANAVTKQKLASDDKYKADYKMNIQGKPPHDTTLAYPQYELMKNISKQTSQVCLTLHNPLLTNICYLGIFLHPERVH